MSVFRRLIRSFQNLAAALLASSGRVLMAIARPGRRSQSGFILPTVTLVILVVTLVVAAILARSYDRAKNASNFRVNQATLSAAAPALDRARAKLDAAFEDPTLPRGTPSDLSINQVLTKDRYTLPDEARLRIAINFRDPGGIQTDGSLPEQEASITTWRFPVDTDNNGRFDSFTLYGLYFRSPSRSPAGGFARARQPLDARTPPQDDGNSTSAACAAAQGTSASLVGADGWFKSGALLKKSFYTYVATVPITSLNDPQLLGDPENPNSPLDPNRYEVFQGNRGFSALEYQQDRTRIPLGNNAIVYEDDLDMRSGTPLSINGRVVVNSNLLASETAGQQLRFYQVSSEESCFYEAENAKIIVGGNVVNGTLANNSDRGTIDVDLFRGRGTNPTGYAPPVGTASINDTQESATTATSLTAYNTLAYEQRIELLISATFTNVPFAVPGFPGCRTTQNCIVTGDDPEPVRDRVQERLNEDGSKDNPSSARRKELEVWFRNRTRRVPFAEVAFGADATAGFNEGNVLQGAGTDNLRPPDAWINPQSASVTLAPDQLPATDPDQLSLTEDLLGDRITVGNSLPAKWFDASINDFATADSRQEITPPTAWTQPTPAPNRYRQTQVRELVDVGLTDRDGFWETKAAENPKNRLDAIGGLRIVTGAGVYLPGNENVNGTPQPNWSHVIWPDTLPQPPDRRAGRDNNAANHPNHQKVFYDDGSGTPVALDDDTALRPYLKMRATAVYHYTSGDPEATGTPPPAPIACVSSFYDPTTYETAQNRPGLPGVDPSPSGSINASGGLANNAALGSNGNSNNGITYNPPAFNTGDARLVYESNLVYPNGRLANPLLKQALEKIATVGVNNLSLAERGAIDSTLCALQILDGGLGLGPQSGYNLPHGTIQEIAFLDARQVQQVDGDYITQPEVGAGSTVPPFAYPTGEPNNNLPVENRQTLEIRATVIDLDVLRRQDAPEIPAGPLTEWMFPDSGIIYATRDDALPDASGKQAQSYTLSEGPGNNSDDPDTPYRENLGDVNLALYENNSERVSGTDFWLDPTRRPNAIMLINGRRLARNDDNQFTKSGVADGEEEKGLTLATNLPIYIKAQAGSPPGFNIHDQEEFTAALDVVNYSNFYGRTEGQLNPNFACRQGDPRLACTTGDNWRAVSVLGDSLTLLSETFRPGFRNEGNYDLDNHQTDNFFRTITPTGFPNSRTNFTPISSPPAPGLFDPSEAWRTAVSLPPTPTDPTDTVQERRLFQGFWDNAFGINGLSSANANSAFTGLANDATHTDPRYVGGAAPLNSTYFNNFVTPIQRRQDDFAEYLMESCNKLPVSECTANDWAINDASDLKASDQVGSAPSDSGTTAVAPSKALQSKPRRVAFLRWTPAMSTAFGAGSLTIDGSAVTTEPNEGDLLLAGGNFPIPLGIDDSGNIACYTYGTGTLVLDSVPPSGPILDCQPLSNANRPRAAANALRFRLAWENTNPFDKTTNLKNDDRYRYNLGDPRGLYLEDPNQAPPLGISQTFAANRQQQPRLVPVLQIHNTTANAGWSPYTNGRNDPFGFFWLPRVPSAYGTAGTSPQFNLLMAVGDTPARSDEFNGAVSNLPRFLENWFDVNGILNISGSFIQLKRSSYATAPFWHLIAKSNNLNNQSGNPSLFDYSQLYATNLNDGGRNNAYIAPLRRWGFDVGLLSQFPDLFSQRFTLPPTDAPNEYYREANRSDAWITALLCARSASTDPNNPLADGGRNAVPQNQRPASANCDQ